MSVNELLIQKNMTKYRLCKENGVPQATISDICSGKTSIEKCSAETLFRIRLAFVCIFASVCLFI